MNVFSALQAAVLEEARPHLPSSFPLLPFQRLVSILREPYSCYRSFRFTALFQGSRGGPSQNAAFIQGIALHVLGDFTKIGSFALRIILAVKCAEDLLEEYRKLGDCYKKLQQTLSCQYPAYELISKKQISILPPFLLLRQRELQGVIEQIGKVTRAVLDMNAQGLRLGMRLYEAYLLFSGDPQTRFEGCVELVAEWDRYQELLKKDCRRFMEELQKKSGLADRILSHLGQEIKTEGIIKMLQEAFDKIGNNWLKDGKEAFLKTLDSVFPVGGKMTPLHIRFSPGSKSSSPLPSSPFPTWAGQQQMNKMT